MIRLRTVLPSHEVWTSELDVPTIEGLWFETIVINADGQVDDYCERYSSGADAYAGHDRAVEQFS